MAKFEITRIATKMGNGIDVSLEQITDQQPTNVCVLVDATRMIFLTVEETRELAAALTHYADALTEKFTKP